MPHDATAIERPLCCALPMPAAMLTPMLPTALDSALPLRNAVLSRSHSAIRSFQKVSCSLSALALAIAPELLTDADSALVCALPAPAATFKPMLPAASDSTASPDGMDTSRAGCWASALPGRARTAAAIQTTTLSRFAARATAPIAAAVPTTTEADALRLHRIGDAAAIATPFDTIFVAASGIPYAETVRIQTRVTLLGDSAAYVASARDAERLPTISHDSGAAAVVITGGLPVTVRYLTISHAVDGAAVDARASDIEVVSARPEGEIETLHGLAFDRSRPRDGFVYATDSLHLRVLRGRDRHHVIEAAFKALGGSLIASVHDELIGELPEEHAELGCKIMSSFMVDLINPRLRVKLSADAHYGDTWLSAKKG